MLSIYAINVSSYLCFSFLYFFPLIFHSLLGKKIQKYQKTNILFNLHLRLHILRRRPNHRLQTSIAIHLYNYAQQ